MKVEEGVGDTAREREILRYIDTQREREKGGGGTYMWTRHTLLPRRPRLSLWTLHRRKKKAEEAIHISNAATDSLLYTLF